jgi:hypothetical protein
MMLLLNKIKTDLNLTRNEFIYGLVTTTRRLERLAAQVEVTYKFCAAPKEAARVAVINPPSVRNMKKMWVVKDRTFRSEVLDPLGDVGGGTLTNRLQRPS